MMIKRSLPKYNARSPLARGRALYLAALGSTAADHASHFFNYSSGAYLWLIAINLGFSRATAVVVKRSPLKNLITVFCTAP